MLVEADLPDDPAVLRAMLLAADTRLAERDQRIADLEGADIDARQEIERLNAIIDALQRHRFGARSEQFDPDQLDLAFVEIGAALMGVVIEARWSRPIDLSASRNPRGLISLDGSRLTDRQLLWPEQPPLRMVPSSRALARRKRDSGAAAPSGDRM